MHWNSAAEFFAMGGYALYVWGSFGITAAVMAIEVLLLGRQRARVLRNLHDELRSEGSPT